MPSKIIGLAVLLFWSGALWANEVDMTRAVENVRHDIKEATLELSKIRQQQTTEKIAITNSLGNLEHQVVPLREKVNLFRDMAWEKETGFQALKEDVNYLKEEIQFCSALLSEYQKDMKTRLSLPETYYFQPGLKKIENGLASDDPVEVLAQMEALLGFSQKRNRRQIGGTVYAGKAIDQHGRVIEGDIMQIGPLTYFISDDETRAGLVSIHGGNTLPTIVHTVNPSNLKALKKNKRALLPIDITMGEAVKVKNQKKSWWRHISAGGIVMIPILALGLGCLCFAVWKFILLRKLNLNVEPVLKLVLELVNQGKMNKALEEAEKIDEPFAPVLVEGIKHSRSSKEDIEEMMYEKILAQQPGLEKYLAFLAVSAAAAPLLGLLGTVTGMIHTFDLVAVFGTGKVNILSGGISEALITTEFGLLVAIPALLIHAYFNRRVKSIVHTMEQTVTSFINGLSVKKTKKTRRAVK